MRRVFVDSSHLIAIFNPDDAYHARAVQVATDSERVRGTRFVTTLAVLEEFLTDAAARHAQAKADAAQFVEVILEDPSFEVFALDVSLFRKALDLYRNRLDKSYSMVDCVSMVVCKDRGISEVLTTDRDFEQERFVALLRQ